MSTEKHNNKFSNQTCANMREADPHHVCIFHYCCCRLAKVTSNYNETPADVNCYTKQSVTCYRLMVNSEIQKKITE